MLQTEPPSSGPCLLRLAPLVVALLSISLLSYAQVPADIDLFVSLGADAQDARSGGATVRERLVAVDLELLEAARVNTDRPRTGAAVMRLNLFDNTVLNVVIDDTGPTSAGYWLAGHLVGDELSDVILVVNGELIVGTVRAPGATYAIRSVGNGVHVVRQLDPIMLLSSDDDSLSPAPPARPAQVGPRRAQPIGRPVPARERGKQRGSRRGRVAHRCPRRVYPGRQGRGRRT